MTNSRFTSYSTNKKGNLGSSIPIFLFLLTLFCFNQNTQAQSCAPVCKNIQVSLDMNCEATITVPMVFDSSGCPGYDYVLELFYDQAATMPVPTSPMIDRSELGTIIAKVTAYDGPTAVNNCWSFITVEDKIGPTIDCSNDTLGCFDLPIYTGPTVSDNCFSPSEIDLDIINQVPSNFTCNPNYLRSIVITWQATDGSGMTAQCDQTVLIERIDTSLIHFPPHRTEANMNALTCDVDYDLNNDGVLDPDLLGVPHYDGRPLPAGNYPECNVAVTFVDTDFGLINCKRKIMRLWTVREWYCNQEIELSMPQLIEIVDTTGPVITCPNDLTVTTTTGQCDAQVYLPPASATDDCSQIIRYDVTYPGGFLNGQNGGQISLPVGKHRVVYTVYDECLNSDTCSIYVNVVDNTPPIAICDQHTVVSLTNNGKARVPAAVFDDGSYDECGIDRFEVRRMNSACGYNTVFGPFVEFSCCDLGAPIMVVFRVYDLAGNFNDCMVEVTVQDKLAPIIVCPPNITISCTYPYDLTNLDVFGKVVGLDSFGQLNNPILDPRDSININDPGKLPYFGSQYWGKDGYALGSCNVSVTQTATPYLDQCGIGFIYRVFTATNSSGVSVSCAQTISVDDFTPFDGNTIVFPPDMTIRGGCGGDVDPSVTGRPTYVNDDCELIGVSDPIDLVFNFNDPTNPACFKILRTWKVINWCTYNSLTGEGLWEDTQIIKVVNEEGPTITGCDDVSICSFDSDCIDTHVDVSINATDDCTDFAGLRFSYSIDLDNDGSFNLSNTNNPFADFGNPKNVASGTYPIGTHRIVWGVEDGCGNETTCESLIEVENCTEPIAYCYNGLSAALGPVDRDGDGNYDGAEVVIWASDFDAGSSHSCYDDVVVSFSRDTSDTNIKFNCDSIGRRYVELWATAPNGMQSRCIAFIDIQDNNNICPPGSGTDSLSGSIVGRVATPQGDRMEDAMIELGGSPLSQMTDNTGYYAFMNMRYGGAYQVDPGFDGHYLNGVTANDLSLIQRHIAGILDLDSPYKHFAADANHDKSVDIRDVLDLRKLLLGIYDELPDSDSWVFLDAACTYGTGNPLTQNCSEVYDIPNFTQDMIVDFMGIKVGDVDEDVQVNLTSGETRSDRHVSLITNDIYLQEGNRYEIPVRIEDGAQLNAIQLTYSLNPGSAIIHDIREESMTGAAFNTNFASRGLISQVWADVDQVSFNGQEATVVIEITATQSGLLSEVLEISSQLTEAIGFDAEGAKDIRLEFDQDVTVQGDAFELFQNKPNPFADETMIGFKLPEAGPVVLTVTDMSGRQLYRVAQDFTAGAHEVTISKSELNASGIMYYRLETGKNTATKKMILLD